MTTALERVGVTRTTIEVDGARLAVRAVGRGRPLIVLHGGPDFDDEYLLPDVDVLADLALVVSYAQRGRGRSWAGEAADDVSIDGDVADLDAVRAWTAHEQVAILGHSFGAVLAMEYATRQPERVSHLVLMNPAPASHTDALAMRAHIARLRSPEQQERMAALAVDPGYLAGDPDVERERYAIHFASAFHDPAHLEVILGRLRRNFGPDAIVAARSIEDRLYEDTWNRATYDLLPRLATLRLPALVLLGDHDFVPVELARHLADAIPGARLEVLRDCGHFALLEQPAAVHDAVAAFAGYAARCGDGGATHRRS